MKKVGMMLFSVLVAFGLIGTMALLLFGTEHLLRVVGIIGH